MSEPTPAAEFDFDGLEPKSIHVRYKGQRYLLTEASEDASAKYKNASAKCGRRNADDSMVFTDGIGEIQALLVSCCLFQTEPDGSVKLNSSKQPVNVSLGTVKGWLHRVVRPLFDWVKKNSELVEEAETREQLLKEKERVERRLAALPDGGEGPPAKNGHGASETT